MSQKPKLKLSLNISIDLIKREFQQELESQLKGVDISHNFNDIVEIVCLFAEDYFKNDLKCLKKEAVMHFLQQFTTKHTLELSSQVERVIRKKINKKTFKYFLLKCFRVFF